MSTEARFLPDFGDPAGAFARAADWLQAGAQSPTHSFHWPTLATTGADGQPEARVLVLRRFDPAGRAAEVHTDARSPKVAQLAADPRACLLFHDPDARVQVKLPVTVAMHRGDAAARAAWEALTDRTRGTYATPWPSGTVVPPGADTATPAVGADHPAFADFVLLRCHFAGLEVLELRPDGNRRGRLTWADGWKLERLAP